MTIGKRLKEERVRLGLSQPQLATVAGVGKNTIIEWEKDDVAGANSRALAAFALTGLDVLYIVTGRREQRLPADQQPYDTLSAQAFLDALEARFHQLQPWPLSQEHRDGLAAERTELHRIAGMEALPAKLRARADQMLYMAFQDAEAEERLDNRFRAIARRMREADAAIDRAARIAGTEAPPLLKANLMKLVSDYAIDPEDLAPVLAMIADPEGE